MRSIGIVLKTMGAALLLLCVVIPHHTTALNLQAVRDAVSFQINAGEDSLWSQSSQYVSDGAVATFEGLTSSVAQLPPWEKIIQFANGLLKATDERLDAAAREFDVAGKVADFRNTFYNIVSASTEIREHMTELTHKGVTLDQISDELGVIFNNVLDHLKKAFPPPDQAPSHEERQKMVTTVLDKAEEGLLDFARKHGMSENGLERLSESFDRLKPHVQKLVIITGDLIEQHPILFDTLIFSGVAMLIPESWILRPLLSLLGFGPSGPVKGSPAAWAQRLFWGATVGKNSWFAILQRAGMKGISRARPIMGAIGGVIGAFFGTLPCFLSRSFHP